MKLSSFVLLCAFSTLREIFPRQNFPQSNKVAKNAKGRGMLLRPKDQNTKHRTCGMPFLGFETNDDRRFPF